MQAKSLRIFAIAVLLIGCVSVVSFAAVTKSISMTNAHEKAASCVVIKANVVKTHTPIARCLTKGHSALGKTIAMAPKAKTFAGGKIKARILAR